MMKPVAKLSSVSKLLGLISFGTLLMTSLPAIARPGIVTTHANVRSGASLNAPVRELLAPNGTVEVLNIVQGKDGWKWYYVRSEIEGTEEGWVRSDLIRFTPSNWRHAVLRGDRENRINVRSAPSISSSIAHYGIGGDVIEIDDRSMTREGNYFWYRVTFPNQVSGWVRGDLFIRIE
ncbi:SH3 domain-containing protein [Leptolyngbya boryana CZ1]|uniref:SH3 domain-containing protein n=1 Tax=Leptolyngbya boryana CZ1 TaxID=3060204 RepID=A0AA96WVR8_LEPBY|nr:SH3 domain-containing protein [Leptolyngbya boryana]WNZ46416.1 SH3 domain-containing protein [Leptolyngbya boryana CZ1]